MAKGIKNEIAIIGMGCTKFGELWDKSEDDLIVDAFLEAVTDAGIDREDIDAAWFGSCFDEVNVGKKSFWNLGCGELIHREIGQWLRANRLVPWPYRRPPKLLLVPVEGPRFRLQKLSS